MGLDKELIKVAQDAGVGILALLVLGLAIFGIIQLISLLKQRSSSEASESSKFLDLLTRQIEQFEHISDGLKEVVLVAQAAIKVAQDADVRNQERFEMSLNIMSKVHEQRNEEFKKLPEQTRDAIQPIVETVRIGLEEHLRGIIAKLELLDKKMNSLPQAESLETVKVEIIDLRKEFDVFKLKIEFMIQALETRESASIQGTEKLPDSEALPAE